MSLPADVLLVGSVPLESGEEVMRACGRSLGDRVVGLPDGETGDRIMWVTYQAYRVFHEHPQLDTLQRPTPVDGQEQWMPKGLDDMWSFRIKDGVVIWPASASPPSAGSGAVRRSTCPTCWTSTALWPGPFEALPADAATPSRQPEGAPEDDGGPPCGPAPASSTRRAAGGPSPATGCR